MKKIFYRLIGFLILSIIVFIAIGYIQRMSPGQPYLLSNKDLKKYEKLSEQNNTEARKKLFMHYRVGVNDYNKAMDIVEEGAKLKDPYFEYLYATNLIGYIKSYPSDDSSKDKKIYEEAVYYLKDAARQGFKEAIEELNKLPGKREVSHHLKIPPKKSKKIGK